MRPIGSISGGRDTMTRMTDTSDNKLIISVARNGDREAFSELFDRYHKRFYALSLKISHDAEMAEDAAQSAMLLVWRRAITFKGESVSASQWLLKIAAVECLKLMKSARVQKNRVEKKRVQESVLELQNSAADQLERGEQISLLRAALGGLPPLQQRLVTLYYVTGLRQEEIGKALGIPQRTISTKLSSALKKIREEFSKAGKAVSPAMIGSLMMEDLASSLQVSSEISDRARAAMEGLMESPAAAGRLSRNGILFGVILFSAALCSAGAMWMASGRGSSVVAESYDTPVLASPALNQGESAVYKWDFNEPDLKGLKLLSGSWEQLKQGGPDGSGCMKINSLVYLTFDGPLPPLPFLLSFRVKQQANDYIYVPSWGARITNAVINEFSFGNSKPTTGWSTMKCMVTDRWICVTHEDLFHFLILSESEMNKGFRIQLTRGWLIDDLKIEGDEDNRLGFSCVPPVSEMMNAVQKIPQELRHAKRLLPGLTLPAKDASRPNRLFLANFPGSKAHTPNLSNTWSFDAAKDLTDFSLVYGQWKHQLKGPEGDPQKNSSPGYANILKGEYLSFFMIDGFRLPVLITARLEIKPGKKSEYPRFDVVRLQRSKQSILMNAFPSKNSSKKRYVTIQTYITDTYREVWLDNKRVSLNFDNTLPSGPFGEISTNSGARLDYLEAKSISPSELPPLGVYRKALEKAFGPEGAKANVGDKIFVPTLAPPLQGKKVYLKFTK